MDPRRWARIESLYHAALAKAPRERGDYLASACGQEPDMRRAVESLLLGAFEAGKPRVWSNTQVLGMGLVHNVDLAPDGQRVLMFLRPDPVEEPEGPVQVTFLLNFFDYLRRQAPGEK
jgi:hypothetical protein